MTGRIGKRCWLLMYPLAIIVVFFSWQVVPLYFPGASYRIDIGDLEAKTKISLMQINVSYTNTEYTKLIELIRASEPTIITLNEVDLNWLTKIKAAVGGSYPYTSELPSADYRGMAILSKIPLRGEEVYYFGSGDPPVIRVMLDDDLSLIALHTKSPISKDWSESRDAMINGVAGLISNLPGSIIVAGDFNTTIHSAAFRETLNRIGLRDGRRGHGWKPSWQYGTPMAVAIDHILYRGDDIFVQDFRIGPYIGSDHRPIIADILLDIS